MNRERTQANTVPNAVPPRRNAPLAAKVFVFLHLFAITVWALPNPPTPIRQGKVEPFGTDWILVGNDRYLKTQGLIKGYLFATGFWQYWDMFAPNPSKVDYYGTAEVTYRDGTRLHYKYPRVYELPIAQKYIAERYRKFYERAHVTSYTFLWAPFAQRVALINFKDTKNPPVEITLTVHSRAVAPPGKHQETAYQSEDYYHYAVNQKKLFADAGIR